MKLIVGLGNPGKSYENTRHNIGFKILDEISKDFGILDMSLSSKFHGIFGEVNLDGQKVLFVKPVTFMNLSGTSVQSVVSFYKIKIDDILVIHDEIDLPVGTIKYKNGGGSAGHNGLKSIIQKIGSSDFHRIRIGVGRPQNQMQVSDYVLSRFLDKEESIILSEYINIKNILQEFLNNN